MKNFYKNLKGYSIGIAIFLFAIPVLMYYISTVLIFPIDLFIFKIIAIFLILTGVIFIILSNIYMIKKGKGCPADAHGGKCADLGQMHPHDQGGNGGYHQGVP